MNHDHPPNPVMPGSPPCGKCSGQTDCCLKRLIAARARDEEQRNARRITAPIENDAFWQRQDPWPQQQQRPEDPCSSHD